MKKLNDNWFIEGMIDLEYQQYILLDYLQFVTNFYKEFKLYPCLGDLIHQRESLLNFKGNKNGLLASFPKRITGVNLEERKISYETQEDHLLLPIIEIIDFALPKIERQIDIGKAIYEAMEKQIHIEPIGISSHLSNEGYVFIHGDRFIKVFKFTISYLDIESERCKGINFKLQACYDIASEKVSPKMKFKILNKNKEIPNSTSYFVNIRKDFSDVLEESILPIIKRKLLSTL